MHVDLILDAVIGHFRAQSTSSDTFFAMRRCDSAILSGKKIVLLAEFTILYNLGHCFSKGKTWPKPC